jgi:cytochrome oxidase Cu insertion factor (SCO1/SenC/PrrC family)
MAAAGRAVGAAVVLLLLLFLLGLLLTARPAAAELPRLGAAPNFALTTQQNDRLWLTHLRGRAVVLGFACTACGACPDAVPALADLARRLGDAVGRRVFLAVVSVDPARDSPPVLRRFLHERGLDPRGWLLLTGTPAEVAVVAQRYGVTVGRAGDRITADCRLVLIDGDGTIRGTYTPADRDRLAADLTGLVSPP